MDCPFCKINFEKTRILEEGKKSFVVFSNPRLMPGHILVIPKRHIGNISELIEDERNEIFNFLVKYEKKILEKISDGCDIRQNYRPFIKDGRLKVSHLHFHLQPRKFEDELFEKCQVYETTLFMNLETSEKLLTPLFARP